MRINEAEKREKIEPSCKAVRKKWHLVAIAQWSKIDFS